MSFLSNNLLPEDAEAQALRNCIAALILESHEEYPALQAPTIPLILLSLLIDLANTQPEPAEARRRYAAILLGEH